MDGEDAVPPHLLQGVLERVALGDKFAGSFRQQECAVAFVQVPDRREDVERPDRANPPDAKHELLVEPHLASAHVQDVGDRAVGVVVLGDVRVEQEDRHSTDLHAPDGDRQHPPGQLDFDRERLAVLALDAPDGHE